MQDSRIKVGLAGYRIAGFGQDYRIVAGFAGYIKR